MSAPELSREPAEIASVAMGCFASISPTRVGVGVGAAIEIALQVARHFEPRHAGLAEERWCGPHGEPAPQVDFPKDFIDRRSTVASALNRLATVTLVDEPIFSAQARVTMLSDSLAVVSNFAAPAATLISSFDDFSNARARELPEAVRTALHAADKPVVFVVLNQVGAFEDVILYTSLFNFARAFAVYQTGPWQSLKQTLVARQDRSFPLIERRAIERAAFRLIDLAWSACWQQPIDRQSKVLLDMLSNVKALVTR